MDMLYYIRMNNMKQDPIGKVTHYKPIPTKITQGQQSIGRKEHMYTKTKVRIINAKKQKNWEGNQNENKC